MVRHKVSLPYQPFFLVVLKLPVLCPSLPSFVSIIVDLLDKCKVGSTGPRRNAVDCMRKRTVPRIYALVSSAPHPQLLTNMTIYCKSATFSQQPA